MGQITKIFKRGQIIYQNEALGLVIKSDLRGQSRSLDLKLGIFGVISAQNPKIGEPRQIIYQNDALAHVITKKMISSSPEVTGSQIRGYLGSFQDKV